jgi:hypothetical protein
MAVTVLFLIGKIFRPWNVNTLLIQISASVFRVLCLIWKKFIRPINVNILPIKFITPVFTVLCLIGKKLIRIWNVITVPIKYIAMISTVQCKIIGKSSLKLKMWLLYHIHKAFLIYFISIRLIFDEISKEKPI